MQVCIDLDNATCGVVTDSMVNAIVTCPAPSRLSHRCIKAHILVEIKALT